MDECASESKVTEPAAGASRRQHAACALDRQTLSGLPKISGLKTAYSVKVNERSVDQLFALHERTGFLDLAKAARSQPYREMIRGNWRRLLRAEDAFLYVISDPTRPSRAVIPVNASRIAADVRPLSSQLRICIPGTPLLNDANARRIWQ